MKITFEGTENQMENLKALIEYGSNDLPTEAELTVNDAKKVLKDNNHFGILYNTYDVEYRCNELGVTLNEEEMLKVVYYLDNKADSNIGISWDVIDTVIDMVKSKMI